MEKLIIPEKTNLIINDTRLDTKGVLCGLNALSSRRVQFIVFDRIDITPPLTSSIESILSDTKNPQVVFPGKGSQTVKEVVPKLLLRQIESEGKVYDTDTTRQFINGKPELPSANIPPTLIKKLTNGGNIWIIDDVVSTGQTIQIIKKDIEQQLSELQTPDTSYSPDLRFSFPQVSIPEIKYIVFTWFKQWTAKTNGFIIYPSIIYERRTGKVPLNSMSTILKTDSIGRIVRQNYSEKYFDSPAEFTGLLYELNKELQNNE